MVLSLTLASQCFEMTKGIFTSFPLGNSLLLLVNCNWGTKWHLLSNDNVKALCKNLVLQCVPTQHDTFFCIPVRNGPMSTQPILPPKSLVGIFSKYDRKEKSEMVMTRRSAYPCTDEHIFKGLVLKYSKITRIFQALERKCLYHASVLLCEITDSSPLILGI